MPVVYINFELGDSTEPDQRLTSVQMGRVGQGSFEARFRLCHVVGSQDDNRFQRAFSLGRTHLTRVV